MRRWRSSCRSCVSDQPRGVEGDIRAGATGGRAGTAVGPGGPPGVGLPGDAGKVREGGIALAARVVRGDAGLPARPTAQVRPVAPARRVVRVHVPERTLEGVLPPLLAPVAQHQFPKRHVVARHQDHRVPRKQKRPAVLRPPPDHHAMPLRVPPARAVRREGRLLLHADVRPRAVGKSLDPLRNGPAPRVVRHADRVVPSAGGARANHPALVVGVVRPAATARPSTVRRRTPRAANSPGCRRSSCAPARTNRRPPRCPSRR